MCGDAGGGGIFFLNKTFSSHMEIELKVCQLLAYLLHNFVRPSLL